MISWIICITIYVAAILASHRLVPAEHRRNYSQCPKGGAFWLAFLLSNSIWITAAIQSIVAPSTLFPLWMRVFGAAYMVVGYTLQIWAWRVNYFLLPAVIYVPPEFRATTGPYRFCSHPFYLGCIFASVGIVWLLGQWWALYPLIGYLTLILYRLNIETRLLSK